jgi:CubicO group peptidase (beta-lactamase class C family)
VTVDRSAFLRLATCASAVAFFPRDARAAQVVVSGELHPEYADFDNLVVQFMVDKSIRSGQLAFGKNGNVLFAHGYTNSTDPAYMRTFSDSIFRVASLSKAFTSACLTQLVAHGTFTEDTPLFDYIGVDTVLVSGQKPDPRIGRVTVGQAIAHTAGLEPSGPNDPEFQYRRIENEIDASGPLTREQFARYVYGIGLVSDPGRTYAYSNIGYFLLGRAIEKASGREYYDYLRSAVLAPIGIDDVVLSATAVSGRLPNEVVYDDGNARGLSVLDPRSQEMLPLPYGGATYWETFDACSDLATSARSLVTFMAHYAAWGTGPRHPGAARAGAMPGTESVMYSRKDGIDYAFVFNQRPDADPFQTDFRRLLDARFDRGV